MVQWLRICLPMWGTQVWALVWEDSTCYGATKPVHHSYRAHVLQLLKSKCLEPVLCNKRSHHNEKPVHCNWRVAPTDATRESLPTAMKMQCFKKKKKKRSSHFYWPVAVGGQAWDMGRGQDKHKDTEWSSAEVPLAVWSSSHECY